MTLIGVPLLGDKLMQLHKQPPSGGCGKWMCPLLHEACELKNSTPNMTQEYFCFNKISQLFLAMEFIFVCNELLFMFYVLL